MITAIDILYLVLAVAVIAITIVVVVVGVQLTQVLADVKRVSASIEEIVYLLRRISQVAFPGVEEAAKRVNAIEKKIGDFVEKKIDNLIDR
jgi:low affinity Fe/Cu permease